MASSDIGDWRYILTGSIGRDIRRIRNHTHSGANPSIYKYCPNVCPKDCPGVYPKD